MEQFNINNLLLIGNILHKYHLWSFTNYNKRSISKTLLSETPIWQLASLKHGNLSWLWYKRWRYVWCTCQLLLNLSWNKIKMRVLVSTFVCMMVLEYQRRIIVIFVVMYSNWIICRTGFSNFLPVTLTKIRLKHWKILHKFIFLQAA